jgi:hypothetical protein
MNDSLSAHLGDLEKIWLQRSQDYLVQSRLADSDRALILCALALTFEHLARDLAAMRRE